ncbi:Transcription termination factor, mitochondrial/chloroplastic [Dillenia turbinata]|uniref:Transcription termination factor, mitochondrial/chloroplastic n=1 Tax=Dillenia turbinata TaxID=194707 RepID=A0AAN8Z1K7_9MAGN
MALRVLSRTAIKRLKSNPKLVLALQNLILSQSFSKSTNPRTQKISQNTQYRLTVALANLLQRYGFPRTQLHNFISNNQFLLKYDLYEVQQSMNLLLSLKLPQKSLVSIISNCPEVLEHEFLKNWKRVLSDLEFRNGNELVVIQNVLELSRRFELDPIEFNEKIQVLRNLGFGVGAVIRVLEEFPRVIMLNESELHRRVEFLDGIGISMNDIDLVCNLFPGILWFGVENRVRPLFDEFEGLGFSRDVIRDEVVREPRLLGMELGEFSRCLELLRTLKCRVAIKDKIFSCGTFRAVFEAKLRIDCLCRHGLIRREALKVLWLEPRPILYDLEDIERKIEFLVNKMKLNIACLAEAPEYLGVNFEKEIVPRYNVIDYLRSKGGLGCNMGLKGLIKPSRLRFYNLYVKPYPECEKMYGRVSKKVDEVKAQHPVGLWKFFKPQKYPESKEDIKNMRLFMEQ